MSIYSTRGFLSTFLFPSFRAESLTIPKNPQTTRSPPLKSNYFLDPFIELSVPFDILPRFPPIRPVSFFSFSRADHPLNLGLPFLPFDFKLFTDSIVTTPPQLTDIEFFPSVFFFSYNLIKVPLFPFQFRSPFFYSQYPDPRMARVLVNFPHFFFLVRRRSFACFQLSSGLLHDGSFPGEDRSGRLVPFPHPF